ncbi:MAG: hypothetical protein H8M99_10825 [Gloeobacteraceae cyanobacterium ES-bin-144]|nr:hypothetical protein [Verrucomicrobiales bacterium]
MMFLLQMKTWLVRLLVVSSAITGFLSCTPAYYPSPRQTAASEASAIQRTERPGLATGWGNQKSSPVAGRAFIRSSSKPVGSDVIYYNNLQGIENMASQPTRVSGMQSAAGNLVHWGIKGRFGFLPTFKENWGQNRRFVAGETDKPYSIAIHNDSDSPLEIVASVDGLDVQDGKPASFSKRGYLVDAQQTILIDGFRTSYSHVAAFKFSSVAGSYANLRHGDTRNVGVIGIAVFTQKGERSWATAPGESKIRASAKPFSETPN